MSKLIKLNERFSAIVDDADFEWLNNIKWHAHLSYGKYYAGTFENGKRITMHRIIMGVTDPQIIVDHANRNTLDNGRDNLRIATPSQNSANRGPRKNTTSKYKGVYWSIDHKAWKVRVSKNGKCKYVGYFKDEDAAALAYNKAAMELHGEFAFQNKIDIFPQKELVDLVYDL